MRNIVFLALIVWIPAARGVCQGGEPHASEFVAFQSEYYRAYFRAAAEEAFEPGEVIGDQERSHVRFELRLKSAQWAKAVAANMLLSLRSDGTFRFSYPSFQSPPKGVGMIDLEPELKAVRHLAGTWIRTNERIVLRITRVDGEPVRGRRPWNGRWRGNDVMLDSLGDVGPMLAQEVHLKLK